MSFVSAASKVSFDVIVDCGMPGNPAEIRGFVDSVAAAGMPGRPLVGDSLALSEATLGMPGSPDDAMAGGMAPASGDPPMTGWGFASVSTRSAAPCFEKACFHVPLKKQAAMTAP